MVLRYYLAYLNGVVFTPEAHTVLSDLLVSIAQTQQGLAEHSHAMQQTKVFTVGNKNYIWAECSFEARIFSAHQEFTKCISWDPPSADHPLAVTCPENWKDQSKRLLEGIFSICKPLLCMGCTSASLPQLLIAGVSPSSEKSTARNGNKLHLVLTSSISLVYQPQQEKCLPGQKNNSLQLLFGANENLLLTVKGSQTWRERIASSATGWERAQTLGKQLGHRWMVFVCRKQAPCLRRSYRFNSQEKKKQNTIPLPHKLKQKSAQHQADGRCWGCVDLSQASITHEWLLHPPVVPTSSAH